MFRDLRVKALGKQILPEATKQQKNTTNYTSLLPALGPQPQTLNPTRADTRHSRCRALGDPVSLARKTVNVENHLALPYLDPKPYSPP